MDDDLKRWRELATDPSLSHNQPLLTSTSGVDLYPLKKKGDQKSHVPEHHLHKHPSKSNNFISFDHGRKVVQDRVFVHSVLDRISAAQKKDIDILWTGHLNHNNINKALNTTPFQQRKFGRPKEPTKSLSPTIPNEYIPQTPQISSVCSPALFDDKKKQPSLSSKNIDHIDIPDNMHDLLQKFDSVKKKRDSVDVYEFGQYSFASCRQVATTAANVSVTGISPAAKENILVGNINNANIALFPNQSKPTATTVAVTNSVINKDDPAIQRKYMPAPALNLTRHGQYKSLKYTDYDLVQSKWARKHESSMSESLKELTAFLRKELEVLGCSEQGPDMRRLQVYRYVFDRIITDFKHYGPILAEIKAEYDSFIASHNLDQNELIFLRGKVRKLLAQVNHNPSSTMIAIFTANLAFFKNENRLLLKFERKKSIQMETLIVHLKHENDFLNTELKRKLALYASYLPPALLSEKKCTDSMIAQVESMIDNKFGPGDDPISRYEKQICGLTDDVQIKAAEISKLKTAQEQDFVPKSTHVKLGSDHIEITEKFSKLKKMHEQLEEELKAKNLSVGKLESALKEKEEQYHFLIAEYTGLAESMAKKPGIS
ncbi:Clathrin heavy chain linker domain-containing protein 1 [Physocladia obscura]|uniref:Clathrin heavy chain linker domain-containing protein 1 n=1 Tax=Physocladia obscura TaxID=109957 RepID=A0AAD5T7C4_9FUNG|nr:Clathrin heavy chain linker domain-containing protein 1 [Physocladia obscura]